MNDELPFEFNNSTGKATLAEHRSMLYLFHLHTEQHFWSDELLVFLVAGRSLNCASSLDI